MPLSDFISVIVPSNEVERSIYRDIVMSVGLAEPIIVDPFKIENRVKSSIGTNIKEAIIKKALAQEVANVVANQKSVILGLKHYNMAFCYNDEETTPLIFDAHNDSYLDFQGRDFSFGDGNFLRERKGVTYILGSYIGSDNQKIKVYQPRKISKVLKEEISDKLFLSLEVDVLASNVTSAHSYPHNRWLENILRLFHYELHLSFKDVLESSLKLVVNKNLVGVNIAGYRPLLDEPDYKTAGLLKRYLSSILY